MVLGLLCDPDPPAQPAEQVAGELPQLLTERLDNQVSPTGSPWPRCPPSAPASWTGGSGSWLSTW
jgi:hypothetical protein